MLISLYWVFLVLTKFWQQSPVTIFTKLQLHSIPASTWEKWHASPVKKFNEQVTFFSKMGTKFSKSFLQRLWWHTMEWSDGQKKALLNWEQQYFYEYISLSKYLDWKNSNEKLHHVSTLLPILNSTMMEPWSKGNQNNRITFVFAFRHSF